MNGLSLPAACLCLWTGAAMGAFFLALKFLRMLLHGGRILTAVFDFCFCLLCSGAVFLCALAVDKGRLRLAQGVLQGLGAWGAVAALDPFVVGVAALIRRLGAKMRAAVLRPGIWIKKKIGGKATKIFQKIRAKPRKSKKQPKRRKKRKKALEKLT